MAKSKQKAPSAAQRRDKQRQQRQQRLAGSQNNRTQVAQAQARSRGPAQRQSNRRQWLWTGGIVALIAVIIVAFFVISRIQQSPGSASGPTTLASSQVFNAVTKVDPNVLAAVRTGGVTNPLHALQGSPPILKGPTGKPEVLYVGGEFCPYCAAERWAVVVALSRFGTFSKLYQTTSSSTDVDPNTPTFTFYPGHYGGSFYSSSYIDFVPVETEDQQQNPLQTPTTDQQNLLSKYDAAPYTSQAGSIPFIDFGNRYVLIGASYNAQDLANLQWQNIANDLADSNSAVSKDILGTANYLTAGICMMTQQQPGSVCSTPVIQSIEQSLGKAVGPGGPQIAVSGPLEAVLRRQD